jgi:hypothetical protein
LPSRLGDDPLARAGRGTAKPAAEADATASPVVLDSFGGPATPQRQIQLDSNGAAIALQRSHNDVFFLRRGDGDKPPETVQIEQKNHEPVEAREISEVSEIPEIREVAAAPVVGSELDSETVAEPSQPQEAVRDADAQGAIAITPPETVPPVETGELVVQPAMQVEEPPGPNQEPIGLPAAVPDSSQSEGSDPEKSDGLFKKVFGKLEK